MVLRVAPQKAILAAQAQKGRTTEMPEDDKDLFFNLFEVDEPTNEFGEPIPEGEAEAEAEIEEDDTPAEPETPVETPEPVVEQPLVEEQPEVTPKVQTAEDNARFAEQRRQQQAQERADKIADEKLKASPQFQMAEVLAKQYGMTPDQLLVKMQEAALQREAQEKGIPVEFLQQMDVERKARMELEQRLNKTEFENWHVNKQTEKGLLKTKFPVLTDAELDEAVVYQLETLKNPGLALEKAVFALHGDKITQHLVTQAKQEALAEISGRKQGALPPQGGRTPSTDSGLSAEERYVAKRMGISEVDYLKYKTSD